MTSMASDYVSLSGSDQSRALKLHHESIIIDGLCYMRAPTHDSYLKTLVEAGITATNVTVPEVNFGFEQTVRRVGDWYASINRFSDLFTQIRTIEDIHQAKRDGKTAIIMGFQDTLPLEMDLKLVDVFHALGVRIIQLTYQYRNLVGGGCGEEDPGLSGFGRDLVARLNEVGILIDLSHCGPRTSAEAIDLSDAPPAFTHAGLLDLCDHVRNKSDELIQAIAARGGLIGLPSYSQFLDIRGTHCPTLVEYLDAMEHVIGLTGIDHVGIGFDFTPTWVEADYNASAVVYPEIYLDYTFQDTPIRGLLRVTDSVAVTGGLIARGYSDDDIKKVLGGNFLRVFEATWK
ncbi:MAG: hypothetical protein HOH74_26870 [Gemmatimonadetes bacterium]|nr:hypothetical protein [Gemmatimonadota bacterium]